MHILIAFIIGACLLAGYHPLESRPKGQIYLVLNTGEKVIIRPKVKPFTEEFLRKHIVRQHFDYSCGSAALATLLDFYLGENLSENQVIMGLMQYGDIEKIKKRRAFSLLDMKKFVTVLGYKAAGYQATIDDLKTLKVPGIIPIKIFNYRHFVVFRGIYDNHVFVADPWRGNSSYTLSKFKEMWYKNVIFIVEPNGRKPVNLLKLSDEDLRFIDEDMARRTLFNASVYWNLPAKRDIDGMPTKYNYYKNK